ncbi:unnamed protein product [Protopolystoma xenopodis]|uniref:Uncharacterized protein n=1 Tax=Protopolystoma xenopodis TaxID=117903 RepID=A0A3S5CJK2_9PLAT|nr:unnamed protein product [Protopolystoma xenopodis]
MCFGAIIAGELRDKEDSNAHKPPGLTCTDRNQSLCRIVRFRLRLPCHSGRAEASVRRGAAFRRTPPHRARAPRRRATRPQQPRAARTAGGRTRARARARARPKRGARRGSGRGGRRCWGQATHRRDSALARQSEGAQGYPRLGVGRAFVSPSRSARLPLTRHALATFIARPVAVTVAVGVGVVVVGVAARPIAALCSTGQHHLALRRWPKTRRFFMPNRRLRGTCLTVGREEGPRNGSKSSLRCPPCTRQQTVT